MKLNLQRSYRSPLWGAFSRISSMNVEIECTIKSRNVTISIAAVLLLLGLNLGARAEDRAYMITATRQFGVINLNTGAFQVLGNTVPVLLGLGQTTDGKLYGSDANGILYQVNPPDGNATIVGSIGAANNGVGSTTSGLYALDTSLSLYAINANTGTATRIGSTGINPNIGVVATSGLSTGSAILYLTFGPSNAPDTLYSVNTATGAATAIGMSGVDGIGAMVFENGKLYAGSNWQGSYQADTVYALNPATGIGAFVAHASGGATQFYGLAPAPSPATYYFPHLAFSGGWQTILTYINYSPQSVTCVTNFLTDSGEPLLAPFGGRAASTRTDVLQPGQSIHDQSTADLNAPLTQGWAQATCSGPVQASLLYRFYQQGVAGAEVGVNAMTAPATKFITFAETKTGVAFANPSTTQSALITFTAISSAGLKLSAATVTLAPGAHAAAYLGPLLGLQSFTGSIEIISSAPIVSLSLNAEAFPVISSLPPGQLSDSTPLVFQ